MQARCPKSDSHTNNPGAKFCRCCGAPLLTDAIRLADGAVLQDRYRIIKLLGEGGMGAVYKALDLNLNGRACAVKEMRPDSHSDAAAISEARQQFRTEAHTLATINHPNLPRVTDYFSKDGNIYLIMDFIEGESLMDLLGASKGPLDESQVLAWILQLCDTLSYIHERNIIHRDIKPSNIIQNPENKVVLVDFGLIKLFDPDNPQTIKAIRGMGTPEYCPLEQYARGGLHTDARSDIYSLGATMYHLLTNHIPPEAFKRKSEPDLLKSPIDLNPQLSPAVAEVIVRTIEIFPDKRYQTASEMKSALLKASSEASKVGKRMWFRRRGLSLFK